MRSLRRLRLSVRVDERLFLITGGPGSGKTTLLRELERRGFRTASTEEAAILETCDRYRYTARMYFWRRWKEIYQQDSERRQDFTEAVLTYHTISSRRFTRSVGTN